MGAQLTVLFNLLPAMPEAIQKAASRIVRKAAFDIQALAAEQAPFETGFLKGSIYVVTKDESTYGNVSEPPQGASMLPEVEKPSSPTIAYVAVGADYGLYQELGTANMAAQPYLTPAAELVKPEYIAAMKALERHIDETVEL